MTMHFIGTSGVMNGSTSGYTFTNIPQTFSHLQIRMFARFTGTSSLQSFLMYPNSDGTANKSIHRVYGSGTGTASQNFVNQDLWIASGIPTVSDPAGVFGVAIVDIFDYANTSKNKTFKSLSGSDCNGTGEIHIGSGSWQTTTAISSFLIAAGTGNMASGSRIDLYGITSSPNTGA